MTLEPSKTTARPWQVERDVGVRLVVLARQLEVLRAIVHGHVQVMRGMCSDELDHREIDRALVRLDDQINP